MPPKKRTSKKRGDESGPWYADGLKFKCTQCGNCCTGAPGYVFVNQKEIDAIAEFVGRADRGLTKKHLRRVYGNSYSLTEDPNNGDCCFLKTTPDGKRTCSIYPVRPLQCRTWPFWDDLLESPDAWDFAADGCPGMNRGKTHDLVQIRVRLNARDWDDLPS